jgi:hypothetical protein
MIRNHSLSLSFSFSLYNQTIKSYRYDCVIHIFSFFLGETSPGNRGRSQYDKKSSGALRIQEEAKPSLMKKGSALNEIIH